MNITVLVPSFERPAELDRCLAALAAQDQAAYELVLVLDAQDDASRGIIRRWASRLPLRLCIVGQASQVHALNAGLRHCTGDIVAITDDDAAPRPDWLARILRHFAADPSLGVAGGRDWVHKNGRVEAGGRRVVGRVLWFGRAVGNHHLGAGPARPVDMLKGANIAFRMAAIARIGFDERLRGRGAEVHNDMAASLAVKRAGWRLIYDPAIAVDHYPAPRADGSRDNPPDPAAVYDMAFNYSLAIQSLASRKRRWAARLWHRLVGAANEPGLVWALRQCGSRGMAGYRAWRAASAARHDARQIGLPP